MGMKAPIIMRPIDMKRGESKETDTYKKYTLKINIQ